MTECSDVRDRIAHIVQDAVVGTLVGGDMTANVTNSTDRIMSIVRAALERLEVLEERAIVAEKALFRAEFALERIRSDVGRRINDAALATPVSTGQQGGTE